MTATFYSQDGQDKFIASLVMAKKNGIFLDIGAFDGINFSNTYFFEKNLSWSGICVEPNPVVYEKLKNNRKCICINACVSERAGTFKFLKVSGWGMMLSGLLDFLDPKHLQRIDEAIKSHGGEKVIIDVPAQPVRKILRDNNIMMIDYCNIDVEGGEMSVLKSIDFSKVTIKIFTIENNYADKEIGTFLRKLGYRKIWRVGADDVYELNSKRYKLIFKLRWKSFKERGSKFYRGITKR